MESRTSKGWKECELFPLSNYYFSWLQPVTGSCNQDNKLFNWKRDSCVTEGSSRRHDKQYLFMDLFQRMAKETNNQINYRFLWQVTFSTDFVLIFFNIYITFERFGFTRINFYFVPLHNTEVYYTTTQLWT